MGGPAYSVGGRSAAQGQTMLKKNSSRMASEGFTSQGFGGRQVKFDEHKNQSSMTFGTGSSMNTNSKEEIPRIPSRSGAGGIMQLQQNSRATKKNEGDAAKNAVKSYPPRIDPFRFKRYIQNSDALPDFQLD